MKKINKEQNKNLFKKIFIQIARKLGYEIIDQNNLYIPTLKKSADDNLSKPGISSITIPTGKINITRKVTDLTIIIRSYTSTEVEKSKIMLDQNKKRIFEFPKIEYTLRTINSIINSCNIALNFFKEIKIKLIITDDNSSKENLEKINNLLIKANFETSIINLGKNEFSDQIKKKDINDKPITDGMFSNMKNILKSIQLTSESANDLVYFLEDDYIHQKDAITEMLFTYEKISSQLNKDIFLCPADYPYLYSKVESSNIFIGNMRHWRTIKETLITFLTSKKMILKYFDELNSMATVRHHPMEKKLHDIYEKEDCFSPIPSLAMHCTFINSVYGIPPIYDWKKIWDESEIK